MDKIEKHIKEELNYEIKKSSHDILREYNLRNAAKSKKAFRINFKFLFGGLGLGLAALIGVISFIPTLTKTNNGSNVSGNGNLDNNDNIDRNDNIDNNDTTVPITSIIDATNLRLIENLSETQIEEYNDLAVEMNSVVTVINSTLNNNADNTGSSTEDIIKGSFSEVIEVVNDAYNPNATFAVYEADYTTTLKGKEQDLDYVMLFNEKYVFYFNTDITRHKNGKEEIIGELEIDDKKYRVSGEKLVTETDMGTNVKIDFQIFLDEETENYLFFTKIFGESEEFKYSLSLGKVRYYTIRVTNLPNDEEGREVVEVYILDNNITTDADLLKKIDEMTYTVTVQEDSSFIVEYVANGAKNSINGVFPVVK